MKKIALVHDWLDTFGGAEGVVEAISRLYPFTLYTLFASEKMKNRAAFKGAAIETSFIERLPRAKTKARHYLPLFPLAIEQFNLKEHDIIISSSSCVAKGVLPQDNQFHLCYCHTPMRYAWDLYFDYLRDFNLEKGIKGFLARLSLHYLRLWDKQSTDRVHAFVANSHFVAERIKRLYDRHAHVIYPPIDTQFFALNKTKEDFYVTASRLVPYKKIAQIIEAFGQMPDKQLVVIGDGSEREKLEALASPYKNIKLMGRLSREELRDYLQRAKAFIFAALEDFGMAPLEAQSCGTPVLAYGQGGALESVVEGKTGLFFKEQTAEAIMKSVQTFEKSEALFDPEVIRQHAEQFDTRVFEKTFSAYVKQAFNKWAQDRQAPTSLNV